MSIEFYYAPYSSASRVHWALEELRVPHVKIRKNLEQGETHTADYLTLNPNGKVPLLVVDGRPLFESLAILLYLGDRFGVEAKLWPGPNDPTREAALSWTVWSTTELGRSLGGYARAASSDKAAAQQEVHALLGILERQLAGRTYLLGDRFSLVDVANASAIWWGRGLGVDLAPFPNVVAWTDRCIERPEQKATRG